MTWSNEELVEASSEALDNISEAISVLNGIEEFKEVLSFLEETQSKLKEEQEPYKKLYEKECQEELDYQNLEYERSVLQC